ncbi:hypothetical protein [Solibacillus sp. CAU 1738]|uniref:hypothetical protein n=1 Tax=Solibacillus sp. CAU 1738 TaxID=3140363 RepID=UPI0032602E15
MEKRLQELSNIQIDEQQKQQSYAQINRRLQRQSWKIPMIIISFCAIFMLLVVTTPELQQAQNETQISKIVVAQGEANVVSAWQFGVRQIVDEQQLLDFAAIYERLHKVEDLELLQMPSFTIKIIFSDKTSKRYKIYPYDGRESSIFYEIDTSTYFQTAESTFGDVYDTLDSRIENNLVLLWFVPLGCFMYIQLRINRKMRVIGEKDRKLPRHSTYWQSVSAIITGILVFSLIGNNLHFGWIVLILLLNLVICLFLESRYGKNQWRYVAFVMDSVYVLFFFFLYFYIIY